MKIRVFFLYLFVIACIEFFSPRFLPIEIKDTLAKAIIYVTFFVLYLSALSSKKYKNPFNSNLYNKSFVLICIAIIVSPIMASSQHEDQSFFVSIVAILPYLIPFLLFFILNRLNIPSHKIEKLLLIIGIINVLLVFQLFYLSPNQLFGGIGLNEDGRGVRLNVWGDIFKMVLFFYSINQFLITKKKLWIIVIVLCFITIIFSLTRQIMFWSLILAVIFFITKVKLYKKIIGLIFFVFLFQFIIELPYIQNLMMISTHQIEQNELDQDIRVIAFKYYINDNQENVATRILGNGCDSYGNSVWGEVRHQEMQNTQCYPTDVGIAAFYYYFGILGILGLLGILIVTIKIKIPPQYLYCKYVVYYILLASIASGPILYYHQCIVLPLVCYLIKINNVNYNNKNNGSNNNIELQ